MPSLTTWLAFVGLATAMVLLPGPNMMVLVSRAICQGPRAGPGLGVTQIAVSVIGNGTIARSAGSVAAFVIRRPRWAQIQRRIMGNMRGARAADGIWVRRRSAG